MNKSDKSYNASEKQNGQTACASDEVDLYRLFLLFMRYRLIILSFTFIALLTSVFFSMRQPRLYLATSSIVPPANTQGNLMGQLNGLGAGLFQGVLNQGGRSDQYVGILQSRAVADAIIERFDLTKSDSHAVSKTGARIALRNQTQIESSRDGIIRISVKDQDPQRAAAICNAYVEHLDQQNRRLSGSQVRGQRIFLENRLKEIKTELSQIESLQSREAQIKEMLFELLTKECEVTKIEEAKSMPTIQVLDFAEVPEQGIARGTVKKSFVVSAVAMAMACFSVCVWDYIKKIKTFDGASLHAPLSESARDGKVHFDELQNQRKVVASHRKKPTHSHPSVSSSI